MENHHVLHDLYEQREEQVEIIKQLERDRGKMSEAEYNRRVDVATNKADNFGKAIDREIEEQGLSEEDYSKAREEWEQDKGHER
jgi:uncharacterized secreted protein with C-terminal beta-propeller domain